MDAKIAIVGEAPGTQEEKLGSPFIGWSGQMLNEALSKAGINRHDCYVTNVTKHRPPDNDFAVFYEDSKKTIPTPYLLDSIRLLHQEIQQVRPNITIALGGEALRALTGRE
jgi:DNA polymerase